MTPTPDHPLGEARLRAGREFDLVVYDRLGEDERAAFAELLGDPSFYGVLRPAPGSGARTYRTVDRATALLLLTLGEPGPLPFFASDPEAADGLVDLILDGVLEIEVDGRFVAGEQAASHLVTAPADRGRGRLETLTHEALRHAAALRDGTPERLAALLYDFNRLPLAPKSARRLADPDAVLRFLGLGPGSAMRRILDAGYEASSGAGQPSGWATFTPRRPAETRPGARFKLYLSPTVTELPRALAELVPLLAERARTPFKVGSDAAGLHRPDKLVAYFDDLDSLLGVARRLEERLEGMAAQGVPFTAPIDAAGLLSWGVDPPPHARPLSWQGPESWRTWLVGRLASYLARCTDANPEAACSFALTRIAREGIDTERWLPTSRAFRVA